MCDERVQYQELFTIEQVNFIDTKIVICPIKIDRTYNVRKELWLRRSRTVRLQIQNKSMNLEPWLGQIVFGIGYSASQKDKICG